MEKFQVLIIDDDKDVAEYFQAVLNLMGYEVDMVLSARDALSVLAATVPNLVLLDLRLGREIGGEDILYQIRSNPRFDKTRVIVVTGYPKTAEMVTNLADLVLLKPVDVEQFRLLVTRMAHFESETKTLPFRDPVTQLFNRDFFLTRLDLAFERARRRMDFLFSVVVLQIDLAQEYENQVLLEISIPILGEISERLKHNLRPTDTIARVSGWKFVTLFEDLRQEEDVNIITTRLQNVLAEPFKIGANEYRVKVNFGIAFHRPTYREPQQIYEAAEQALKKALAV